MKKKDTLTVSKSLMIKALLLSFILLTIAFGLGLAIGRTDDSLQNMTSADEGEVREQLSDCSFKLQEITAKHLSLINAAKSKGLVDGSGIIQKNIMCTVLNADVKVDLTEKDTVKLVQTQEKSKKEEQAQKTETPDKKLQVKRKLVHSTCSFSIQLFSDPDKTKALKAKKSYPFNTSKLRLVEAEIRGRSWYRIRYGCYTTRAEAEIDLPEVKDVVDSAIVVAD